jgi:hypothetical protein
MHTDTIETGGSIQHTLWTLTARLGAVAAGLLVMSLLVVTGSRAAFNATTSNDTNSFAAGTVVLSDDDAGSVMFNLAGMKPGDTSTKCVNVSYTGSLAADVRLYGTVGGTGLASYLDTVVDIGTGATGGAAMDCTGFTSDANLHTGTLDAFGTAHTNFGNGAGGFAGVTGPVTRSYQVTVTLQDDNNAQGRTATATFTWEAQNN